jgi:hypothetical protein
MTGAISRLARYPWQHLPAWVAHARERRRKGCASHRKIAGIGLGSVTAARVVANVS